MRKLLLCGLALSSLTTVAQAAGPAAAGGPPPSFGGNAVFCQGRYALCIKAYCPTPKGLPAPGQKIDCECNIVDGWSMGPDSCEDRAKNLVSTYSNLYNAKDKTLFCESESTIWAWCYGAPCTVDPKDPKKARCSCPVEQSAAKTLGGRCQPSACSKVWSAATPAADAFANDYFFTVGKEKGYSPNPPAVACSNAIAKPGGGSDR
ncbi:MAG: hypothetical protein M3O15_10525 [Acidobacteriota bacterium]|nr:hypothetical protein [Acidobacteriota bacterium]